MNHSLFAVGRRPRTLVLSRNRWFGCLLSLAWAVPALGATVTVTNLNDAGQGSLRSAIAAADDGDTIEFSPNVKGAIILTSGRLLVNRKVTIHGPGASQLAIDGNHGNYPVFVLDDASRIVGLTIRNGGDAGIENLAESELIDCVVSGNRTSGIFNVEALKVINTRITANRAINGGGIETLGTLSLISSTVSRNEAIQDGGAIFVRAGGRVTATNTTFSGNFYNGIFNNGGQITLVNSTVSDTSRNAVINAGGQITLKSTLLANNGQFNCSGNASSLGYNLSDDDSCSSFMIRTGDENNVPRGAGLDPRGPQPNGGLTQTIALLPESPAVNRIPVAACTNAEGRRIDSDQRGIPRPQGAACDTGAFELVQGVPFSNFKPVSLQIQLGKKPGFTLDASFTLGSASKGIDPLTQPVTLAIENNIITIPAGLFERGPLASYVYRGAIHGTELYFSIAPEDDNSYKVMANGLPVEWGAIRNPVVLSLIVGDNNGSTSVRATIRQ